MKGIPGSDTGAGHPRSHCAQRRVLARGAQGFLLALIQSQTGIGAARAQEIRASEAVCSGCRLAFETVVRFGADGTIVGATSSVVRHKLGWLVAHEYDLSRISVFDDKGVLVRSVGRKGRGPGEFEAVAEILVSRQDSVYVIDPAADRISVLDPQLQFVRTEPLPLHGVEGDVLTDGSFLFNAKVATRQSLGYPLHIVRGGLVVRSFGAVNPVYRRDMPNLGARMMGHVRDDHIWIAHWGRYRLERWNLETQVLDRGIERPVSWFPDVSGIYRRGGEKPVTRITGIHEDYQGRIWIAITVADDRWESARMLQGGVRGVQLYKVGSYKEYWDTILECIDSRTGEVLASVRTDELVHGFTSNDFIIIYDETEAGEPLIELRRPVLTQNPLNRR